MRIISQRQVLLGSEAMQGIAKGSKAYHGSGCADGVLRLRYCSVKSACGCENLVMMFS
jgi:hypothetical protein